jgi:mRNA interferase RelE/StbE
LNYKITFKESVSRDLKKIDKHQVNKILNKIEEILSERAETIPSLKGKFSGLRRLRIGNYRVIYAIIEDSVLITRIQHRKDAYRT